MVRGSSWRWSEGLERSWGRGSSCPDGPRAGELQAIPSPAPLVCRLWRVSGVDPSFPFLLLQFVPASVPTAPLKGCASGDR
jgi:hypothetical protein